MAKSPTKSSAARSKAGSAAAAKPRASAARAATPADGLALLENAARGTFPSTLYVEGPDEALKAAFLAGLRRAWAVAVPDAPHPRILSTGENDVDEILSAFQGISMFASRELTIVFDIEDLGRSEKRVGALAGGVSHPAGESCLVLVESAAESARKTLEPLRAACSTRWFADPPDARALLAWGRGRLALESLSAEPGLLESLAERCEGETVSFFNEISKLVSLAEPGGTITAADLASLAQPVVGAELRQYLQAVATGQGAVAAQRLARLIAAGEGEGGILFSLGNLVGGALGGWARERELSAVLARRRSRDLGRALDSVYRAEAAWKGGRAEVLAALEQATRDVAAG